MKIEIKVIPRSSKDRITRENDRIKVYVKAPPDKGRANKAVIALLAKEYKMRKRDVVILHGETSRNKIVEISLKNKGGK